MSILLDAPRTRHFRERDEDLTVGSTRLSPIEFGAPKMDDGLGVWEPMDEGLALEIRAPGRRARLLMRATGRQRRGSSLTVHASTPDGLAQARVEMDGPVPPFRFHLSVPDLAGSDPEHAWPIVHFLSLAASPNEFCISLPTSADRSWALVPAKTPPIQPWLAPFVLGLRTIQRRTSTQLQVPSDISTSTVKAVGLAAQLLAGSIVEGRWTDAQIAIPVEGNPPPKEGEPFRVDVYAPLKFSVGERSVTIDRWARLRQARFSTPKRSGSDWLVTLTPVGDDTAEYRGAPYLSSTELVENVASVEAGNWVALLGDAVLADAPSLPELRSVLADADFRPDKIVRATNSDLLGER